MVEWKVFEVKSLICTYHLEMDEIVPGLFISSWEKAKDSGLLSQNGITAVISVGCEYLPTDKCTDIDYLLYPKILDNPEVMIIHIFETCCRYIQKSIDNDKRVLVHCVYGQSRSAAVCVAYLIHSKMNPVDALSLMKEKHSDICINPGFLSQLDLYYKYHQSINAVKVYSLLLTTYGCVDPHLNSINEVVIKKISCKSCGCSLCSSSDIIEAQSVTAESLVETFTDDYWANYRPQSSYTTDVVKFPISKSNDFIVTPALWMVDQMRINVNSTAGELVCPQCSVVCGSWRRRCLNIIGPFNLCDMIVLNRKAVKIKRVII